MCRTCGKRNQIHEFPPEPVAVPAVPGEMGFVYLEYTGRDAKTEFGKATGARYAFWENPVRLVDKRDAETFLASGSFQVVANA
jgi:hypothetical protein